MFSIMPNESDREEINLIGVFEMEKVQQNH